MRDAANRLATVIVEIIKHPETYVGESLGINKPEK
jgi:hypothetical protein